MLNELTAAEQKAFLNLRDIIQNKQSEVSNLVAKHGFTPAAMPEKLALQVTAIEDKIGTKSFDEEIQNFDEENFDSEERNMIPPQSLKAGLKGAKRLFRKPDGTPSKFASLLGKGISGGFKRGAGAGGAGLVDIGVKVGQEGEGGGAAVATGADEKILGMPKKTAYLVIGLIILVIIVIILMKVFKKKKA